LPQLERPAKATSLLVSGGNVFRSKTLSKKQVSLKYC